MQISACCSGNISGLAPIFLFSFSQTTRVTIYMPDFVFIYADTAITLLHSWESLYLSLICLLIKISIFVYIYILDKEMMNTKNMYFLFKIVLFIINYHECYFV